MIDRRLRPLLACALLGSALALPAAAAVRVNGSTTVNPVVVEAAEELARTAGLQVRVDTQGGSGGGIAALGDGRVEVATSSRPVNEDDRRKYPAVDFHPVRIGEDAVALVVGNDVWQAGVRSLSRDQMRAIYEGRSRNWREFGGPDRRIAFFNKEPGRGTWEVFVQWLYGGAEAAPLVSFPEVGSNEEARAKVASTPGGLSQLSASWADGRTVFALAIRGDGGEVVAPTADDVASGRYPMSRGLFVVTNGPPRGETKVLVDFLLSPRGQELVRKHGYLALAEVTATASE